MKTLLKHKILSLIALLLVGFSFGQDVSFTAATSHNTVKTGDRFKIQFTSNAKLANFKAPKLSNFRVLSGPNQSTNMSWINGKTNSTISYSYILMAVKEGEFTIGSAVASANGQAIKTQPFKIRVGKGVQVQQNENKANSQTKSGGSASDELFIRSTVSKRKVYQGEQIIATYKLYTRVGLSGNELIKNADLNGFWSQEIDFGEDEATILTNLGKPRTIGGKLRTNAFGQGDGVYDTENYYRPMAGLKSISTQIKGGTKALKQITVNWVCWDFETLTAFHLL